MQLPGQHNASSERCLRTVASLAQATGKAPGWNFHKHLVDRQGRPVASFASDVTPSDPALLAAIEKALQQR